jgi:hypothetical protein
MAEPVSAPASPPELPVAEAGFLIDSANNTDETAGTLVELAQAGAIRIEDEDNQPQVVSLVDAELAAYGRHQRALLKGVFPLLKAGESRHLRATATISARGGVAEHARTCSAGVTCRSTSAEMPSVLRQGQRSPSVGIFWGLRQGRGRRRGSRSGSSKRRRPTPGT